MFTRAHVRLAIVGAWFATFALVSSAAGQSLPAGWATIDVGAPSLPGAALYNGGTFMVSGAGANIWGTADQFRFAYRQVSGDVNIIARVATIENINPWTRGGIMIRQSLSANAAHASIFVTPTNGLTFHRRASTGSASFYAGTSGAAPHWIKLERRGNTITAFQSLNGAYWTSIGVQPLVLPASFYVGLAVGSQNASRKATGTFSHVSVVPASAAASVSVPPPSITVSSNRSPSVAITGPMVGYTFSAPASVALSAGASDSDGTVTRVDFYWGATLLGSDTTAPYAITWNSVPPGTHAVTAVARDNAGATTVSAVREVTVVGSAMPRNAVFAPSTNHAVAVDRYVLEIFPVGASPSVSNPVATRDLGKPPIVNNLCSVDIGPTISALPAGAYVATVTAVGSMGSTRSAPSPAFSR